MRDCIDTRHIPDLIRPYMKEMDVGGNTENQYIDITNNKLIICGYIINDLDWLNMLPSRCKKIVIKHSVLVLTKDVIIKNSISCFNIWATKIIGVNHLSTLSNIEKLVINFSALNNIDWIVDLPVESCDICRTDINDIRPLIKMKNLKFADIYDDNINWEFLPKDARYEYNTTDGHIIYCKSIYNERDIILRINGTQRDKAEEVINRRKLDFSDEMKSIQL